MIFMKKILDKILDIIYPRSCVLCKKALDGSNQYEAICDQCYKDIVANIPPFCKKCGRHLEPENIDTTDDTCIGCQKKFLHFDRTWSACIYNTKMKDLLHLFKYRHKTILRKPLGKLLLRFIHDFNIPVDKFDFIVPMPIHPARLREREYNQAELIAKELSNMLPLKINKNLAVRIRNTQPQSLLGASSRWENVKGAFKIKYPEEVKNKKILIIDDLFTTGATASEIALTLKKAGAKEVSILTLAIAE
jgi:ComF family protein